MITIIKEPDGFEVWTDCIGGQKDGRCIGSNVKASVAIQEAITALMEDLTELKRALVLYLQKDL